jgi:flagellar biosynthesis/type III secretory pathway chaperone
MIQIVAKLFSEMSTPRTEIFEIHPKYLQKANIPTTIRPNKDQPQFGIISNSGSMSIVNAPQELVDILGNSETKKYVVAFYLKNTISKNLEELQEYYIDGYTYDKISTELNISYSDGLTNWQNINVASEALSQTNLDALSIFRKLVRRTGFENFNYGSYAKDEWGVQNYLQKNDQNTYDILNECVVAYPLIRKTNLWQLWQRLCELCGLNIFKYKGKVIVKRGL